MIDIAPTPLIPSNNITADMKSSPYPSEVDAVKLQGVSTASR